jgi:hypothetical protein
VWKKRELLAVDGTLVHVGAPAEPLSLNVFSLIGDRRAEVEVVPANQVDEAREAYDRGDYGRASYRRGSAKPSALQELGRIKLLDRDDADAR